MKILKNTLILISLSILITSCEVMNALLSVTTSVAAASLTPTTSTSSSASNNVANTSNNANKSSNTTPVPYGYTFLETRANVSVFYELIENYENRTYKYNSKEIKRYKLSLFVRNDSEKAISGSIKFEYSNACQVLGQNSISPGRSGNFSISIPNIDPKSAKIVSDHFAGSIVYYFETEPRVYIAKDMQGLFGPISAWSIK